jgi:hypothetical protein
MRKPKSSNKKRPTELNPEGLKDWVGGADLYRDPDYVEGTHPMDTDDVTWHHYWERPRVEREEE